LGTPILETLLRAVRRGGKLFAKRRAWLNGWKLNAAALRMAFKTDRPILCADGPKIGSVENGMP
jgi:hypothetical protein